MTWWSESVMGGDIPKTYEKEISNFIGGHFDVDEGYVYTRKQLETNLAGVVSMVESDLPDPKIGLQVLGVMAMEIGAKLPGDVKIKIIKAAKEDNWANRGNKRRKYMEDLIEKVLAYEPKKKPVKQQLSGLVRVGVAVLVIQDGKILLGLRKGSHGAGTWSFPGGHQEFGEDPAETAARELLEETGIEINPTVMQRFDWTNDFFRDIQKHYITIYFSVKIDHGDPLVKEPDKCVRWEWFENPPEPLFLPVQSLLKQNPTVFRRR